MLFRFCFVCVWPLLPPCALGVNKELPGHISAFSLSLWLCIFAHFPAERKLRNSGDSYNDFAHKPSGK